MTKLFDIVVSVVLDNIPVRRNTADKPINEWRIITTDFYKPATDNLDNLDYRSSRIRTAIHIHGMYHTNKWNWELQKRMAMAYLVKVTNFCDRFRVNCYCSR